jgi:hypothetical protein
MPRITGSTYNSFFLCFCTKLMPEDFLFTYQSSHMQRALHMNTDQYLLLATTVRVHFRPLHICSPKISWHGPLQKTISYRLVPQKEFLSIDAQYFRIIQFLLPLNANIEMKTSFVFKNSKL